MSDPQVLLVTSAGAPPSAVVPVLAAIEAAGMRVRAIDLGSVGGGGTGVTDRVRRAILGEGAERRLRKELEASPPDAAVVFDPYSAVALTAARDSVPQPAPVIAVVDELEPVAAWAQTDADRFIAVDDVAAVALADAGVDGERIMVVGAIGERAFADAGKQDRTALRTRFKLGGKVALVEVAGLGPEETGQLAMQLSLLNDAKAITYLFDASGDPDSAAVLRRSVPALELRAKLFGAGPDAPLLWRAADVIVARPRPETIARMLLVGGRLVAIVDDSIAGGARAVAALEARKRAIAAKGLLLVSSALESAFGGSLPTPTADGSDHIADIVAVVASDRRGVVDERRQAAQAETHAKVRAASVAANAAAAASAMPGDLEDLSGGVTMPDLDVELPDAAELARLRAEVEARKVELTRSMMASRDAATKYDAAGESSKADAERARMHALLAELATLETELAELERVRKTVSSAPRVPKMDREAVREAVRDAAPPPRTQSVDDMLADLKRKAGGPVPPRAQGAPSSSSAPSSGAAKAAPKSGVDDELAALKRKMASAPPKKK